MSEDKVDKLLAGIPRLALTEGFRARFRKALDSHVKAAEAVNSDCSVRLDYRSLERFREKLRGYSQAPEEIGCGRQVLTGRSVRRFRCALRQFAGYNYSRTALAIAAVVVLVALPILAVISGVNPLRKLPEENSVQSVAGVGEAKFSHVKFARQRAEANGKARAALISYIGGKKQGETLQIGEKAGQSEAY